MHILRLLRRGGQSRTNGPDRLIRHYQCRQARLAIQGALQLRSDDRLCLTRLTLLAGFAHADNRVQAQSDWGIDTLYTFSTTQAGFSVYETYVAQGKAHALYGGLTDLKTMLVECFGAIQSLRSEEVAEGVTHRVEATAAVGPGITEKIGYDIEKTLRMPTNGWNDRQVALLDNFPDPVRSGVLGNRESATFSFMDEEAWLAAYRSFLDHFVPGDDDWEELLFRMWVLRVLNYTTARALRGYEHSQRYLRSMIAAYLRTAALET